MELSSNPLLRQVAVSELCVHLLLAVAYYQNFGDFPETVLLEGCVMTCLRSLSFVATL